ncbi:MAG: hypothetical protein AAF546_13315 [Verrucomicrobiota bacterium]
MTDDRFRELVNLHLDREITKDDLALLQDEIEKNEARRKEFESLHSFHRAMQAALRSAETSGQERTDGFSAHSVVGIRELLVPSIYVAGLAACFAIVFLALGPTFVSSHLAAEVSEEDSYAAGIPEVPEIKIDKTRMVRVMERRRHDDSRKATLATQLRLLGMNPGILPVERELASVDLEEQKIRRRVIIPTHTERIEQLVELSPIPETPIIRYQEPSNYGSTAGAWPVGFKTSLASFK